MVESGGSPKQLMSREGLAPITDRAAVEAAVEAAMVAAPDLVTRYRAGNANLLGALVGQVMRRTGGKASAVEVQEVLRAKLG